MAGWVQTLRAWWSSLGESRRVDIEAFSRDWEQLSIRMLAENSKFRSLLEAAPDAMVIFDAAGRIVLVNSQAEGMFGCPRKELLGRPVESLFPERCRQEHARYREAGLSGPSTGPVGAGLNLHGRRTDGAEFPVEIRLSPLQAEEEALTISAIRDVTERQRAQAQLEAAAQELARANEELEAFNYSASHDLRAPLRQIDGFSSILEWDYADRLDETGREHLADIRRASQTMARLIDALMELTRVTRCEVRRSQVDLSALAGEVAADLRGAEPGRKVRLLVAAGLTASGDPALLRSVVTNLLSNAWKFTAKSPDAAIEFGRELRGGEAAFFVRDNGAGFDMAHAGKLFTAFQKLHGPGEFAGTGIGLATVRRIVERHGGRVWAEGAVNRGAALYFTVP